MYSFLGLLLNKIDLAFQLKYSLSYLLMKVAISICNINHLHLYHFTFLTCSVQSDKHLTDNYERLIWAMWLPMKFQFISS